MSSKQIDKNEFYAVIEVIDNMILRIWHTYKMGSISILILSRSNNIEILTFVRNQFGKFRSKYVKCESEISFVHRPLDTNWSLDKATNNYIALLWKNVRMVNIPTTVFFVYVLFTYDPVRLKKV